jgi:hypothetical protein
MIRIIFSILKYFTIMSFSEYPVKRYIFLQMGTVNLLSFNFLKFKTRFKIIYNLLIFDLYFAYYKVHQLSLFQFPPHFLHFAKILVLNIQTWI